MNNAWECRRGCADRYWFPYDQERSYGQERVHLGMAHSSFLSKGQFSNTLENGLVADERRVPATFPGRWSWALRLWLLLSRDDFSSGLSGGWSSSRISSGPACELCHDLAIPCKARHPLVVAGNTTPAVLCTWAALGWCSQCLCKLELQCLWGRHHGHETFPLASLLERYRVASC